jgi:hypothetical protein
MKDYITKKYAGSGIRKIFIPDPWSKKATDSGSGTLLGRMVI